MSRPDQDLLVSTDGPVATLSINRPAKRNALTATMWRDLAAICAELDADPELRVLVVTGVGPSFCAGADISSLSEDEAVLKEVVQSAERALRNLAMPSIAKISGHCFGGGNQIAVACDLRVADSSASFAVPPARLGVIYPVDSTRALVELVGPAAAKRLIFTAQPIDAAQALRIGLVEQVVPPGELDAAVAELVAAILPLAPMTQFAGKELVNLIADGADADAAFDRWTARWRLSADGAEGPQAFLARRRPVFSWRPEPAGPEPR
jgi:enoyl-CoA hydratase/carnithine racemase